MYFVTHLGAIWDVPFFENGDLALSEDPTWYYDGESRRGEQYIRGPIVYVIPQTETRTVTCRQLHAMAYEFAFGSAASLVLGLSVFQAVAHYFIASSCSVLISGFLVAGCVGLSYHWVAFGVGFVRSDY